MKVMRVLFLKQVMLEKWVGKVNIEKTEEYVTSSCRIPRIT